MKERGVPFALFAPKREEVQDMAILHLAVRPDCFDIAGHIGIALVAGVIGGRHFCIAGRKSV